jgi:hypothetical protein
MQWTCEDENTMSIKNPVSCITMQIITDLHSYTLSFFFDAISRLKTLESLAERFVDIMEASVDKVPFGIRWICYTVRKLAMVSTFDNADCEFKFYTTGLKNNIIRV